MSPIDELDSGLWRWTVTRNGLPPKMTAYALRDGEDTILAGERRRIWYEQRFLPTLRPLAGLDVEGVLVTHGEPVMRGGGGALAESLARPPWSRSSLY